MATAPKGNRRPLGKSPSCLLSAFAALAVAQTAFGYAYWEGSGDGSFSTPATVPGPQ